MYIVIEIQKNADGIMSDITTSFNTLPEAYNKYYSVLAFAAISELPVHSAALMSEEGFVVESKCFKHGA